MKRRQFVQTLGAGSAVAGLGLMSGCATTGSGAKVVVVGGGYGGATAAKYVRMFSDYGIDVTLIEPNAAFVSCPISNLVVGGHKTMADITTPYDNLSKRHGVKMVRDMVDSIDPARRTVKLASGGELPYDRLIVSPGIDFIGDIPGLAKPGAQDKVLHAWKAGPQTLALRRQLEAMPDGGVYALSIPLAPYRCPPGPYERACMAASYFKKAKPRSKVLILDSKDSFSKQALFQQGWQALYGERIEWVGRAGDGRVVRADAGRRELLCEFGQRHRAAVINLIPPQKAAEIAARSGLVDSSGWVPIRPATFQAREAGDIYVAGDACIAAPMPKSAYSANAQAKVAVAALLADLAGQEPPTASWRNTCYSALAPGQAVSIAADYGIREQRLVELPGSLTLSPLQPPAGLRAQEAALADAWYQSICMDAWGHLA